MATCRLNSLIYIRGRSLHFLFSFRKKKENEHWQSLDLLRLFNGVTRIFAQLKMRDDKSMTHCAQSYGIFLIGSVCKEHTSCGGHALLTGRKVCGWADSFRLCHGTSSSVKTGASGCKHEFS